MDRNRTVWGDTHAVNFKTAAFRAPNSADYLSLTEIAPGTWHLAVLLNGRPNRLLKNHLRFAFKAIHGKGGVKT
jgi:hypothetical protein